jgi:hypothetical protein
VPRYSLTVVLMFNVVDDAAARELVGVCSCYPFGRLPVATVAAEKALNLRADSGAARLQRLNDDRQPRLLARWPED